MPITPFTVKNGLTVGSTSVIGSNAKLHANNAITDGTIKNQFLIDHGNPTGTFGSGSKVPVITVDSKGRITNISNADVSGVSSTTWSSANNNFRISTSDGSTYDTVIGSFVTVANADVKYATWNSLTSTNTAIRTLVNSNLANTNSRIANFTATGTHAANFVPDANVTYDLGTSSQRWRDLYLSGNSIILGVATISANVSSGGIILPSGSTITGTGDISLLINDRIQVANATSTFATWSALTSTNTAIRTLVNNNLANTNAEIDLLNTNLIGTNTAIRTLVNNNLANTNAEIDLLNTNLTSTNTAIRSLVSDVDDRVDLLNTNLTSTNTAIRTLVNNNLANTNAEIDLLNTNLTSTNTAIRTLVNNNLANTNAEIDLLNTNLTSTNTAIRAYVDSEVAGLVDSAPETLNTLNELAAALGDDPNFATTLTTNLGQKLGANASITLTGDISGSGSFSANAVSISVTVADDSHNHIISNVDGLSAFLANTNAEIDLLNTNLTSTNTDIRTLVNNNLANTNAEIDLLNTNLTSTNTSIRTLVNNNLANTNAEIDLLNTNLTSTNTALRLLISDRIQVANADVKYATWSSLTGTNTSIRTLVNNNLANTNAEIDLLNTNLTSTNTDIRTLVNNNLANTNAEIDLLNTNLTSTNTAIRDLVGGNLANTNAYIATKVNTTTFNSALANTNQSIANTNAEIDLLNTNLTSTNTSIRTLVSDRIQVANADVKYATWSSLTSTNTSIRAYVDSEVAGLVDSAPATLDTLNELAAALGDDPNFATTLTTNLGQKLGANASITLSGDVSGSGIFSANAVSISVTVADDSHNHVISNIDGLSAFLANTNAEVDLLNTNLTSTNTAIRTLVNNNLANTNAEIDLLNTNLTSTNTSIRTLVNNNLANTNAEIDLLNTNLTSTNTAIRSLISGVSSVSSVAFTTANNNFRISTTDGGTYDATISVLPVLGYINSTIEGSTIVSSSTYDAGLVTESGKDAFGAYISTDILDCMEPSGQVITADCGALT